MDDPASNFQLSTLLIKVALKLLAVLFFVALVAIFYRIFVDIDIKALSLLAEACTLVDI